MRYRLWYAICDLLNNKIITSVTIVMFAISFIVIEKSAIFFLTYNYSKIQAKEVIATSFEDTYRINMSKYCVGFCGEEDRDKIILFLKELQSIDGVKYSGLYYEDNENANMPVLFVSNKLLSLCGITDEQIGDFVCLAGKNTGYVQGDTFNLYNNGFQDYCFTVTDITQSEMKFISSAYFDTSGQMLDLDDYMIVSLDELIKQEPWYVVNGLNNVFFTVDEEYVNDDVIQEINLLAQNQDLDLYGINSMTELFEQFARYSMENIGANYFMPLIMIVSAIVAMIICSIYSVLINKKDYGIMLTNGMTRIDINSIVGMSGILRVIVAFVVASIFVFSYAGRTDINGKEMFIILLPFYIVFMVGICAVVVCSSTLVLRGNNVRNMIEGME